MQGARRMMMLPGRRCYQALSASPASPSLECDTSDVMRAPARRHVPRRYKRETTRKFLRQCL
eukprot:5463735-Pleurochrysis_carterae.AAC.3